MDELLKYAIENGIINLSYVQEKAEMNRRKELLDMHPFSIWKGKDGNWHTYIPDEEKGRIHKKRKSENDIKDLVVRYWKEQLNNPTVKEVFGEWNNRRLELKKISPATVARNTQVFERHYKKFGAKKIKTISSIELEEFLERQVVEHSLTAKGFSNLKSITRGMFIRAKKRNLTNINIDEIIKSLDLTEMSFTKKIKEDYQEVYDDIEMETIIKYLKENPDETNLVIALMFATGIRVGEAVCLKYSDFSINTVNIRRTETRYLNDTGRNVWMIKKMPKTSAGIRTVVVPNSFLWVIEKINNQNRFGEFAFTRNGERIHTYVVRRRLEKICNILGIYHKSPHKIRKTYGTILLDNNIDQKMITSQMGHTNILCTENHYHRNRKNIEQKSEILSKIPDFWN